MELSELIVIYLACGAPFAVHYATSRRPERTVTKLINLVLALLAWPVFAVRLVIERVRYHALAGERRIEGLRAEIEETAFPSNDMQSVFEFRETFYRYVGLSRALNEKASEEFGNDLFETVGHPNDILAARCLARKNRSRLERHRNDARLDFLETITEFSAAPANRDRILGLAAALTEQIGDRVPLTTLPETRPSKLLTETETAPAQAFEAVR